MQTVMPVELCIHETGAPISRSRTVPPPTPVMAAKNMKVRIVRRSRAAARAPETAKTAVPAISRMGRTEVEKASKAGCIMTGAVTGNAGTKKPGAKAGLLRFAEVCSD